MADALLSVQVLLVEDDPGDELLVTAALREATTPVDVAVVPDGVEALAYLRRQGVYAHAACPDLVLLDLKLPKKSGLEVLEEMKNDPALRRTPVVILTTSFTPEDIVKAYDLQASAYLTKPEDLAEFEKVVTALREFCLGVMKFPPRQEPAKPQPGST
jgi:CheY-like chemotaxis protein